MTSTTTSTSVARDQRGGVGADQVRSGRRRAAGSSGSATAMPTSSRRMPVRAATSSARVSRISASAPPTLPQPSRPTRTVGRRMRVRVRRGPLPCAAGRRSPPNGTGCPPATCPRRWRRASLRRRGATRSSKRLPADHDPGGAVGDEDDGRPGHLVVVGGHGVAVGTGDRRGQDVAHLEVVGHEGVGHDEVAALAVLAHHPHRPRARRRRRPGAGRPRSRCRRGRAAGCRSCRRRRSRRSGCPGGA